MEEPTVPSKSITLILILTNSFLFILTSIFPSLVPIFSLSPALIIKNNCFWQFLTYQFIHANIIHLLMNMLSLFFFGFPLEKALGHGRFLIFYLYVGLFSGVSSFLFYLVRGEHFVFLLGASGAIFGVLTLFSLIFPHARVYFWGVLPVPSPILVIAFGIMEFLSQFGHHAGNIAHFTHLFGILFGLLYGIVAFHINPLRVWREAFR